MWSRKDLKEKSKIAFRANYWKMVAVSLLVLIAESGVNAVTYRNSDVKAADITNWLNGLSSSELMIVVLGVLGTIAVIWAFMSLVKIFLLNPLYVGCEKFIKENALSPASFSEIGAGFRTNYGNVVLGIFLRDLFLALWSCLFIIPGIVKAYSYKMVPFIIADNPEMSALDAITKSREMMRGHKWNAFVLDLSFLGWNILSGLTAGILGIFYVNPYVFETYAELYLALREN